MKGLCPTRETSKRSVRVIYLMEEKQIQDFVHRVSSDEELRKELAHDPDGVIMREGFSPRVARIVTRLVPHLTLHQFIDVPLGMWH